MRAKRTDVRRLPGALAALLALWLIAGCGGPERAADALVRAGDRELTRAQLAVIAGVPAESLIVEDQWWLVEAWAERALIEQEGLRRGLEKQPDVQARLSALRSELFRSRLLSAMAPPPPADSTIERYYDERRTEFLRPVDSYLIELYWAEKKELLERFIRDQQRGDTTLLANGRVSSEGRWLADSGELNAEFERDLAATQAGRFTSPRPYEDGFRIARLVESYPAGTVLDLSAVRDEIAQRLIVEQSRKLQDSLLTQLRDRYPVTYYVEGVKRAR